MSSAYKSQEMLLELLIISPIFCRYMGPKTDPWGTPHGKAPEADTRSSTETDKVLSVKSSQSHFVLPLGLWPSASKYDVVDTPLAFIV